MMYYHWNQATDEITYTGGVWSGFNQDYPMVVARTKIAEGVEVSTVFLCLDHRRFGGDEPILFETLVFGGDLDGEMWRYPTAALARLGHEEMVERVRAAIVKGWASEN